MGYIAVFTLFAVPVAKGFASEEDAASYLNQVGADPDSSPIGLYDAYKALVTLYSHEKDTALEEDIVKRIAQAYIERAV